MNVTDKLTFGAGLLYIWQDLDVVYYASVRYVEQHALSKLRFIRSI